jgi:uncharacterized membrane protein YozB (DUF420 family)
MNKLKRLFALFVLYGVASLIISATLYSGLGGSGEPYLPVLALSCALVAATVLLAVIVIWGIEVLDE